jgi:hypothetical protein
VADYKYSLRGLDSGSADYRVKLAEVWICPDVLAVCKLVEYGNLFLSSCHDCCMIDQLF